MKKSMTARGNGPKCCRGVPNVVAEESARKGN